MRKMGPVLSKFCFWGPTTADILKGLGRPSTDYEGRLSKGPVGPYSGDKIPSVVTVGRSPQWAQNPYKVKSRVWGLLNFLCSQKTHKTALFHKNGEARVPDSRCYYVSIEFGPRHETPMFKLLVS